MNHNERGLFLPPPIVNRDPKPEFVVIRQSLTRGLAI